MTRAIIGLRALQTVTGAALLCTAALLAIPSQAAVVPRVPTLPPMQAQEPAPLVNTTALSDSIVNANIFSLAREAPDERTFVAAAADTLPETEAAVPFETDVASGDPAMSVPTNRVPALFGVVNGPAGRAALLRLDAATAGARLFRAGEGTAGYTVRSIGADRVVLHGASGSVTVTLSTRDSVP